VDITIPSLGDIEEVEVIELCVAVGDTVNIDDPIVVIESDKASMELPSTASGTVVEIKVALGDMVGEGSVVAVVEGGKKQKIEEQEEESEQEQEQEQKEAPADDVMPSAVPTGDAVQSTADIDVLVPDIGDAKDVVVIEVAIKQGDQVEVDDLLVVLESDKASMEIAAEQAGTVVTLGVAEGDEVGQGTHIVTLRVQNQQRSDVTHPESVTTPAPPMKPAPSPTDSASGPIELVPASSPDTQAQSTPKASDKKVYAGPAVRRLARELGVDLSSVVGTGNRSRITKDDVKGFVKGRLTSEPAAAAGLPQVASVDFSKFGEVELVELSRIRVRGADNLHRSWVNLPHVTQHDEADVSELEVFRESLKAEAQTKDINITPLSFLVKACCQALAEFPEFNASLHENRTQLVLKKFVNIGFAVDTPEGLVVPVIKGADRLGIWDISKKISELSEKARAKKLAMDDLQGGSFTISSLGAIGGTGFTPIINAPEVAILGVARLATKPIWDGHDFQPRQMLPLSLSYDHRVINGADGGRFMGFLTAILSDIRRLTL